MTTHAKRTPLFDWHLRRGGRMVDFAGWEMPVQYVGIVAEHNAVRSSAGLFDVSHMGRIFVTGPDAGAAIARVVTSSVEKLSVGRVRYGLVLFRNGGTVDDVLVTRLGAERWLVVANASGRDAVRPLLKEASAGRNAVVDDQTEQLAMLAVQGPVAISTVDRWFSADAQPSSLGYYTARESTTTDGLHVLVSRTGYTGEDGLELIFEAAHATALADQLVGDGVVPAGLGARDTLRLEAGMPLYGHELSPEIDPLTAGLAFAVRKTGGFTGAEALASFQPQRSRVGIVFEGRRPVREGANIFVGDRHVGVVTSGTASPTLGAPIAMAFIDVDVAGIGIEVEAEVRGTRIGGRTVELPFYRRPDVSA